MNDTLLRLLLIVIAAITLISGLAQLVAGPTVLGMIASPNALASHLFCTVGMFMAITGAMFLQTLLSRSHERAVPLWIMVQKFAAAILVGWGFAKGLFTALSLPVAAFDAITGVLTLIFWRRTKP